MTQVIDYAEALADLLNTELADRSNKARATTNLRNLSLPGILVSPVPRRNYDLLIGGFLATWNVFAVAQGPGDLTDAKVLDELADVIAEVIPDVELMEPVSYVLPNQPDGKPALRCEFSNEVTP